MSTTDRTWVSSPFARLSTGLKMLMILSLGLFPLGLIAILASLQTARESRADENDDVRAQLEISAQRLNSSIARSALTIRAASAAVASMPANSPVCRATLERLLQTQRSRGRYALYGQDGRLRCSTPGYAAPAYLESKSHAAAEAIIARGGGSIRFALFDESGKAEGLGEYSRDAISDIASMPRTSRDFDLDLVQGSRRMVLRDGFQGGPLVRAVSLTEPVANGRIQMRIVAGAVPIRAAELLLLLLPVMMWIAAAIIGWLIVHRLLLQPLVRMQRAVAAYQPGDRHLDLPTLATPAREIGELGEAFDKVTRTVARHEAELEAAVERQTRLVREVHHRVKNNLQVVASLLNLHSRGSANDEVAAAYASIQRRVDALAVVHRNHYAELEENRGVALKPLLSELAANLRATAPRSAAGMSIALNIDPCYVSQDVAVSLAFLVTELVEFAMFCKAPNVRIEVAANGNGTATMFIDSESLKGGGCTDQALFERFDRIVTGLSRQLRSTLKRDETAGTYSLIFSVIETAAA